jgi:hypothetical protein
MDRVVSLLSPAPSKPKGGKKGRAEGRKRDNLKRKWVPIESEEVLAFRVLYALTDTTKIAFDFLEATINMKCNCCRGTHI